METFVKIAILDNPIEAQALEVELKSRGIPHVMKSYHDTAYDGIFQMTRGWGHVEAPLSRTDEIIKILNDLRKNASASEDEPEG
jgi:hypothetical protein